MALDEVLDSLEASRKKRNEHLLWELISEHGLDISEGKKIEVDSNVNSDGAFTWIRISEQGVYTKLFLEDEKVDRTNIEFSTVNDQPVLTAQIAAIHTKHIEAAINRFGSTAAPE